METKDLLKGKKILIVDDEPDVLDTLQDLLNMCDIVTASTFDEAKAALETQSFDIAILDIMGVNGYALLDVAKQRNVTPVMLTAHALSPEHTIKSYKRGAALYVPKDKIADITYYLEDVLDAISRNKSTWSRWLERFATFYDKKFENDPQWKDTEFWKSFPYA
ncbi:MAG: response regulator [Deltaproteobacteria bacterium]|nr:response regulator [Deltaproteobacteria bacterium]